MPRKPQSKNTQSEGPKHKRNRAFCMTLNNPTDVEFAQVCSLQEKYPDRVTYLCFGREYSGKMHKRSGLPKEHLQIYLETQKAGII